MRRRRPAGLAKPKGASGRHVRKRARRQRTRRWSKASRPRLQATARAIGADVRWETTDTVSGEKGEGARRAVKGTQKWGPLTRAHGDGLVPDPSLSAGGKLRRAGMRCEEPRFATGGNTANPMIGSRAKQTCTVGEENPSRWCETTRTARGRDWLSRPEGRGGDTVPGRRTLRFGTMEGRSLDNPKRGSPTGRSGRMERDATGKSASRSGGLRAHAFACGAPRS